MNDAQPDFGAVFSAFFAQEKFKNGVQYALRHGPCFRHDLHFLSGLIHDARFTLDDLSLRKSEVRISMERDRWEIWEGLPNELLIIPSVLVFRPVISVVYRFARRLPVQSRMGSRKFCGHDASLLITSVSVNSDYWAQSDTFTFSLLGSAIEPDDWEIALEMPKFEADILLKDQRTGKARKGR